MFLMPYLGQWKLGHRFNLAFVFGGLAGAGLLTWMAMKQDNNDPNFQRALRDSHHQAARVIELAQAPSGIPIAGAAALLREDPYIQGPKLFAKHCASCHRHGGHDGQGNPVKDPQSAADLKGFASREWLAGLLDPAKVDSLHYFGGTKFKDGKMVKWVKKNADEPAEQEQLKKVIAALSAEAQLKSQRDADARDIAIIKQGVELARGDVACTDCHAFGKPDPDATAPTLTGYGSRAWLVRFIGNPEHADFYGKRNDRMPLFGEKQILDAKTIGILADWLRGEWYEAPKTAGK